MLVTAKQVIAMNPCSDYSHEGIRERHGENGVTPKQIAEFDIPPEDRFWVLIRLVPVDKRRLVAADIAESVLHLFEKQSPDDERPRKAIEAARSGGPAIASRACDAAYGAARTADTAADAAYAAYVSANASADAAYAADTEQWDKNFEIVLSYIEQEG